MNLEIWDKPASPCLSSRIPYGSEVTPAKLAQIEEAEYFLKGLNIRELRVRHFGEKAKIETRSKDYHIVNEHFQAILRKFKTLGFKNVAAFF